MNLSERRQLTIVVSLIAALMLVGSVGNWPYGYYILLRWVVCAAALYVAYFAYNLKRVWAVVVFGLIAILFNPIAPVHLSRDIWQPIDVITSLVFVSSVFLVKPHVNG